MFRFQSINQSFNQFIGSTAQASNDHGDNKTLP